MTKRVLNIVKTALLASTLFVTGLSVIPQIAKATTIVVTCDGSRNTCVRDETGPIPINYNYGNATQIDIYPN